MMKTFWPTRCIPKNLLPSNNTFAGECVTTIIRDDLVSLLNEEHQIQAEIFEELQKRGLYNVEATSPQQLAQVKEKFSEQ